MWAVIQYRVNNSNHTSQVSAQPDEKSRKDVSTDDVLKPIKEYIEKYAENYLVSFHYLDFPVIICYYNKRPVETENFKILNEVIESQKEVIRILMNDEYEYIKGFHFLRKNVATRKYILQAKDQYTFDIRAANSGLETYIINDLRVTWKNTRYNYLMECLPESVEILYRPDREHPLYKCFLKYLKDIYKRGVDRFKTFICVGSSFIGKSVFFTKFIVPEQYYIYHSNNLEYSKMPDQPNKIFRILDDINWNNVSNTELKALLNRNISSVNIKYGYEYIFPLIPIIIMNKEDYKNFRTQFTDIWEFIERNAVIYPKQVNDSCLQEERRLFTDEIVTDNSEDYLFNEIMDVEELKRYDGKNINEWIKNQLDNTRGFEYDTSRYIQIPEESICMIPNPEINKRSILEEYEKYILKKKENELKNEDDTEKKPWYKRYYPMKKPTYIDRFQNDKYDNKKYNSKDDVYSIDDDSINSMSDDDSFDDKSENGHYGHRISSEDLESEGGSDMSSGISDSESSCSNFGKVVPC